MPEVELKRKEKPVLIKTLNINEVNTGDIVVVENSTNHFNKGLIVLKIYNGWVSLTNPQITWMGTGCPGDRFTLLKNAKITITYEENYA